MLSKFDDYPIHQISDLMRFTASSNRNFYDRYYFNLHNGSDELFVIFGFKRWTFKNNEWVGSRDCSWGIRPVGEEEPRGINKEARSMEGMWNYFPIHFDDFAFK